MGSEVWCDLTVAPDRLFGVACISAHVGFDPDGRIGAVFAAEVRAGGERGELVPLLPGEYDKYWGRGNLDSPLTMFPSEYFLRQFYATSFNDSPARWMFGQWASHNLMWSNDDPHPDSTWSKWREVIARDLGIVSEGTRARLLRESVRELYQLPALTSLAV